MTTGVFCTTCGKVHYIGKINCVFCGSLVTTKDLNRYRSGNQNLMTFSPLNHRVSAHILNNNYDMNLEKTIAPHLESVRNENQVFDHSLYGSFENFKVVEVLGYGGMGVVYKAEDLILGRPVAIKLIQNNTSKNSNNPKLLDEARLVCKLNHPNIVTIYDIRQGVGTDFIVMEWVEGKTLDRIIPSSGMAIEKVLQYACQIADGIAFAHSKQIIHRDIKPQNIMLSADGRIKILDFGIADLIDKQRKPIQSNDFNMKPPMRNNNKLILNPIGTPNYMSPEQIIGSHGDERSDIFSFGILLYEMISGEKPFKSNDIYEYHEKILTQNFQPIEKIKPLIPRELALVLSKMLTPDLDSRWQDIEQLSQKLRQLYEKSTNQKSWWLRQHWISKPILLVLLVTVLWMGVKDIFFPLSTEQIIHQQIAKSTKVALLPFDNITGDPTLQLFVNGLSATLNSDLILAGFEQGDGRIWIIPSSEIQKLNDLSIQSIHNNFGVDLVVSGSIQHLGATRKIQLNLISASDGRQLRTTELIIDSDSLFTGQSSVRNELIKLLGWSITSSLKNNLELEQPGLDGAYKHYIEGIGYLYRHDQPGNMEKALLAFHKAIDLDPDYELAYKGLAETYLREYRLTKNIHWLDEMNNTILILENKNRSNPILYYLSAELALKSGDFDRAVQLFNQSIENQPNHIDTYTGLARAYKELGDTQKSEQIYLKAIEQFPNNNSLLISTGIYYLEQGNYQLAIKNFEKLLQSAPNNHHVHINLSAAYYLIGDIERSIEYTKSAIDLHPTDLSYSNLGTLYFYISKYHEAVTAYEKMIQLNDKDFMNWGNLADAYKLVDSDKKNAAYEKAMELAEDSLELNPHNNEAIAHIAYYLANLDHKERSIKFASQIGEQQNGLENFIVATAYASLNEQELALKHIIIALNKNYPLEEIKSTPLLNALKDNAQYRELIKVK